MRSAAPDSRSGNRRARGGPMRSARGSEEGTRNPHQIYLVWVCAALMAPEALLIPPPPRRRFFFAECGGTRAKEREEAKRAVFEAPIGNLRRWARVARTRLGRHGRG